MGSQLGAVYRALHFPILGAPLLIMNEFIKVNCCHRNVEVSLIIAHSTLRLNYLRMTVDHTNRWSDDAARSFTKR